VYDPRVERVPNIVFARNGGKDLRLDVYRRRDRPRGRPALLYIHGGAWIAGHKNFQGLPLINRLAAHGWTCFTSNYRLSPAATFPDHIVDVKAALRWIREHGAEHGADPDLVVIAGGSAGGHLAALAALTPDEPGWQPGFEDLELRVAACVPLYGVYDFTDRRGHWRNSIMVPMLERAIMKKRLAQAFDDFDRASPMSRVRADAPPFFILHGTHDVLVPIEDARHFAQLLRARSAAPVVYAELPGAQHAFEIFPSERTLHAVRGIEAFLAWVVSRRRAEARQPASAAAR
jgi:acetyl esterase/lipase